ncbi:rhodanese-like domain-containing protein [Pseudoalteromonas luteoviolacea]|uniref:rhodanese-like domain-containing protein n=1 Tax=Pseudoalteromonas luteoviolacea TaxID=43657 RepID=UPI001F2E1689|nr:rhodanese-like domain-containing protein [Pseudoalteromonas luteoviolacea]MCF6440252.1 rhodanese-like domain-containing protein [Pseudoalteromonas luteoviolacea]
MLSSGRFIEAFIIKIVLVSSLCFSAVVSANVQVVKAAELLINQMSDAPYTIIDVRTVEEYADGHIKGAINIPYDQIEAQSFLLNELKDQTLVVYCRSGRRAQIFENTLFKRGFTLFHLEGDILGWKSQGLPLVK